MQRFALTGLLGCLLLPHTAQAISLTDELTLQLKPQVVSDYRSRGLSLNLGDPAAQLDATLIHSGGAYAGIWTSNVDFGMGLKSRLEMDYYAGYYWQATEDISLDVGYLKYTFNKNSEFTQSEVYAIVSAYGFKLGNYYSNDLQTYVGKDQDSLYSFVGYSTELPAQVGLEVRYGRFDFKDPVFVDTDGSGSGDYREWEAKFKRSFLGIDWGLSYIDTDLSDSQCVSYYGYTDVCSSTVVVSASKTF